MQIKKYDETRKVYVCKPKLGEEGEAEDDKSKDKEDIEASHEELSDQIVINIRILTEDT
jgi:hypothetical protein